MVGAAYAQYGGVAVAALDPRGHRTQARMVRRHANVRSTRAGFAGSTGCGEGDRWMSPWP
jgi:hypothetical protein